MSSGPSRLPKESNIQPGNTPVPRRKPWPKRRLHLAGSLLLLSMLAMAAAIVPRSPRMPASIGTLADARSEAHMAGETAAAPATMVPAVAPMMSMAQRLPIEDATAVAAPSRDPLLAAWRDEPHPMHAAYSVPAWLSCTPRMGNAARYNASLQVTVCRAAALASLEKVVEDSSETASVSTTPLLATTTATAAATGQPTAAIATVRAYAATTVPTIQTAHPRLLLDAATLTRMRTDAANNTAEWQALKATCDSYIGGTVNYPTDAQYPNLPNLGSGYQGEVYLPALLAEAMCYQVLKPTNTSAAATYGAKGVDILMKMSTPYSTASGNQGWDPCYDDGYGIRNYGVGFGLGYDWLYDLLNSAQRAQVYTAGNAWITAWEAPNGCAAFAFAHPLSNYYAGYFHAKAVIAIATYGDNPSAPAEWSDWYNNQFSQRVQPYFALHMAGGGWPEGYANYGPPAILNMSLPMREVKTATGVDLVHATAPFRFPLDSADYLMHFTWPSRAYFDDRDTNHSNGTAIPPVGTPWLGTFQQVLGTLNYWGSPEVGVFHQYLNEVNTATSGYHPAATWLAFLDANSTLPTTPLDTLPLSYLATGMGAVAARSDWTTSASWMSFRAAPYVDNPDQAEEGFDQGSLALARGNTPLLVNTYGWMVHEPNGSSDETLLYNDLFGKFNNTQYMGNREIYNIYYVRRMSGSSVLEPFGQSTNNTEDNNVSTKVAAYEDRDGYVFVQATGLADMYRTFSAGPAVSSWTRQIVYLRPNRFVVYDRTTSGGTGYDQYLAWHFPANPVAGSAPSGENLLDITYNGAYVGAMTTVLPANAGLTTVPLYPTSNPVKVWQVQERPAAVGTSQQWLTVFDLSTSAAAVATATPVAVSQGNMVGVQLAASSGNSVVLQSAAAAGTPVSTPIAYTVSAAVAHHVITELVPGTGYNISVTTQGSNQTVTVTQGGTYMSSANGVLDFYINAGGTVQQQQPLTPPSVSILPVPGFPKPYKP